MGQGFALVNAEVWTMKAPKDRAPALVALDGRIEFVGREDRAQQKARAHSLPILDLEGARVVPGLIDSHTHLTHQGILSQRVDLHGTTSLQGALQKVRNAVKKAASGELVLAERFDDSQWKDPVWPTREDLDNISRDHPVIMRRIDGHVAVANTIAADRVADRLHGVDKERGLLVEEASLELHRVFPTSVVHATQACRDAQQQALELGITSVYDFVHASYFRGWQQLHRKGELKLRVKATPFLESLPGMARMGIETGFGDDHLQMGGVKIFGDGTIGGHTAAVTKDYGDDSGNLGRLNWTGDQLMEHFDTAQDANLQIAIHAIGDAAIDQALRKMEDLPRKDRVRLRHRIEHFEMATEEHWAKAVELGVVASVQPNFVGSWGAKGGMYEKRFKDVRYKSTNQFRKMFDAGVPLAFGSDCMPLDPWFGLESVVHAPWPAQRLKIEEALSCYTKGSAFAMHADKDRGVLEKGRLADLVVVEGDWRASSKGGVAKTTVVGTSIGGQWAYQKRKFKETK